MRAGLAVGAGSSAWLKIVIGHGSLWSKNRITPTMAPSAVPFPRKIASSESTE
jgi:hypothetical protein